MKRDIFKNCFRETIKAVFLLRISVVRNLIVVLNEEGELSRFSV